MRDEKGGSLQAPNFKDITEIQTPDDYTVIMVTKQPLAVFLDRLENRFIINKEAVEKAGEHWYQNLIGTGPYKFVSYQRGGNMVFTRNEDYWGGKAAIKEVIFRKVTEDAARLAALESGQADFINNIPVHEVARLKNHPRVRIDQVEGLRMFFLAMNFAMKPFDNKLVRQAVNYSIDAPSIVKNIFDGIGYPCNGPGGRQRHRRRSQAYALSLRSEKGEGAAASGGIRQRLRRAALLFGGALSQGQRSLPGGRGANGQGRFQSRADLAGVGVVWDREE